MLEFKPEDETPFPHKEVTEAIIGSAFEVYNHLGYFRTRVNQRRFGRHRVDCKSLIF